MTTTSQHLPSLDQDVTAADELCASHPLLRDVTKENLPEYMAMIYPRIILHEAKRGGPEVVPDPVVASLAGEVGEIIFARFPEEYVDSNKYCYLCDYFMDQALITRDPEIRQVVLMDIVMDSRPYRLPELADCRVYELNRNAVVLKEKERLLRKGGCKLLAAERYAIQVNPCNEGWQDALLARGFNPAEPTFWMIGSNISYISVVDGEKLVSMVDALSAPHSQIFADMFSGHEIDLKAENKSPEAFEKPAGFEMHGDNAFVFRSLSQWTVELLVRRDEANNYYGSMWDPVKLGNWTETDPDIIKLGPWFLVRFSKVGEP